MLMMELVGEEPTLVLSNIGTCDALSQLADCLGMAWS